MFRSRWSRAGLFLLIVAALLFSGAGHVVFHGDHDHDREGLADLQESGECGACQLLLVNVEPCLTVPTKPQRSTPAIALDPESLHAAFVRRCAAPRAPPVCA